MYAGLKCNMTTTPVTLYPLLFNTPLLPHVIPTMKLTPSSVPESHGNRGMSTCCFHVQLGRHRSNELSPVCVCVYVCACVCVCVCVIIACYRINVGDIMIIIQCIYIYILLNYCRIIYLQYIYNLNE